MTGHGGYFLFCLLFNPYFKALQEYQICGSDYRLEQMEGGGLS